MVTREEGRRQEAEGRRLQYSVGFRPTLIAGHQIRDLEWGLNPCSLWSQHPRRVQYSRMPSALCADAFLAKMQKWFTDSLEPNYQQWLSYIQQPGVRCVDETTYCIEGIKYWLWVATSEQIYVLMLAPTRSSAELEKLLSPNFEGILSSDCFSAYNPQNAGAKQKCLAHLERDLEALETSRFKGNREFARQVKEILTEARSFYRNYQQGNLSPSALAVERHELEARLQEVVDSPPVGGFPADAQRLANRLKRHWNEWFTFLSHPEVKPDNNDAERALRPIVVHRKVSGGARSDWGAQLVAQMFSQKGIRAFSIRIRAEGTRLGCRDQREQGFKPHSKSLIWCPAISIGLKPTLYCHLLPSAEC